MHTKNASSHRLFLILAGFSLTVISCTTSTTSPAPPAVSTVDLDNSGASFEQVWNILKSNPYDPNHLPVNRVSLAEIRSEKMLVDAGRTLDSTADIRPPFRRLVHPNGICLAGEWIIDKPDSHSGLFKAGSRFPIIVRFSPSGDRVRVEKGEFNSFGFVGKVFPAEDRRTPVRTANFFTQTDLGRFESPKSKVLHSGLAMSNAPGVTALNQGPDGLGFAIMGSTFNRVDVQPTQRQLYPLAEAHRSGEPTHTPLYMKVALSPSLDTPDDGAGQDMRLEIRSHLQSKGPLVYEITLSDDGKVIGPAFLQRSFIHWDAAPIGRIVLTEAVLSAACDEQIHFQHPAWRERVDDPASSIRKQHGAGFGQPFVKEQVALAGELVSPKGIRRVFETLNDIQAWPSWVSDGLVRSVRNNSREHFYDLTFRIGGESIHSVCHHEAQPDSAVSMSCRGTAEAALFTASPVQHDITFLLNPLPDGKTKIQWGVLLRSGKAMETRDPLQASIEKSLGRRLGGR